LPRPEAKIKLLLLPKQNALMAQMAVKRMFHPWPKSKARLLAQTERTVALNAIHLSHKSKTKAKLI